MALFVGVDGGGSKTLAVVVDENGQEVGRGRAANANYQAYKGPACDEQEAARMAARQIVTAIREALPVGSSWPIAGIAGLAGIETPLDAERIQNALVQVTENALVESGWQVVNDAEALLFGLPNRQGIALVAGTGSIAIGRDRHGHATRAGGWGYLLGDEGSGYDLGRSALQAAVQAADGRGSLTALLPRILQEWELSRPEQLIEKVYSPASDRNRQIAGLARLVFEVAATGDWVARGLARRAAFDLATTVRAVYDRLHFVNEGLTLGLSGGLLLNLPELKEAVLSQLNKLACHPTRVLELDDPARACALACRDISYNQSLISQR